MPTRLSKIDELTRADHSFLAPEDICYFLGEYTSRAGFSISATNNLIQNLKKPMDRRERPEWRYKTWAIEESAKMLKQAIPLEWYSKVVFVPVPPSKTKDHPDHDDRLVQILHKAGADQGIDVRELVVMTESVEPAHLTGEGRSVEALVPRMTVDMSLARPSPTAICIFDDVLTTGAHFQAVRTHLKARFPAVPMAGLFLARRRALGPE